MNKRTPATPRAQTILQARDEYDLEKVVTPENEVMVQLAFKPEGYTPRLGLSTVTKLMTDLFLWTHKEDTHGPLALGQDSKDNKAVLTFAGAMARKLQLKRSEGRGGWDDPAVCERQHLAKLLFYHLSKGDTVDLGNFAMMLHQRGARPEEVVQWFSEWLTSATGEHPSHRAVCAELGASRKRHDEEYERRIKAEVALDLLKKAQEKELNAMRLKVEGAEVRASLAERNLSRALGYIDRVNEAPQTSRVGNLEQVLTTRGPDLETPGVSSSDGYSNMSRGY